MTPPRGAAPPGIYRPTEEVWWRVARGCRYATFYHTPLWHRLAEESDARLRDRSLALDLSGGGSAILPLLRYRTGPIGVFGETRSTFAGCYGGIIADGPVRADEAERLYREAVGRSRGALRITGNPFAAEAGEPGIVPPPPSTTSPAPFREEEDSTHLLPLDRPFEDVESGFSKGHRSSTTQGRRLGVTTRTAECLEDYRAYHAAYEASLRRWGEDATSRYPRELFERGFRISRDHPDAITLWLAELDGRLVAGAWIFAWNGILHYWHGAAYQEAREVSATNVLLADVIGSACADGRACLDMGPSGGHEGVRAFKRRFGAEERRFVRWNRPSVSDAALRPLGALRRSIARWFGRTADGDLR